MIFVINMFLEKIGFLLALADQPATTNEVESHFHFR